MKICACQRIDKVVHFVRSDACLKAGSQVEVRAEFTFAGCPSRDKRSPLWVARPIHLSRVLSAERGLISPSSLSRVAPTVNTSGQGEQQRCVDKRIPAHLKGLAYSTCLAAVTHVCVKTRGVRWFRLAEGVSKLHTLISKMTIIMRTANSAMGLLFASTTKLKMTNCSRLLLFAP